MGSGGSKKNDSPPAAAPNGNRDRRPSHVDTNPPAKSDLLVECPTCERKFASDRIQRHAEVRRNDTCCFFNTIVSLDRLVGV